MKDKAALLVEVETLKKVRDELSMEVTNLHTQLEQERSKSRLPAGDTKTKDKVSLLGQTYVMLCIMNLNCDRFLFHFYNSLIHTFLRHYKN